MKHETGSKMMMMMMIKQRQRQRQRQKQRPNSESHHTSGEARTSNKVSFLSSVIDEETQTTKKKKIKKFVSRVKVKEKEVEHATEKKVGNDVERNVESGTDEQKQQWEEEDGNKYERKHWRKRGFDVDDSPLVEGEFLTKRQKVDNSEKQIGMENIEYVDSLVKLNLYTKRHNFEDVDMPKELNLPVKRHKIKDLEMRKEKNLHVNRHKFNDVDMLKEKIEQNLHGREQKVMNSDMVKKQNLLVNGHKNDAVDMSKEPIEQNSFVKRQKINVQTEQILHVKKENINNAGMPKQDHRLEARAETIANKNVDPILVMDDEKGANVNRKRKKEDSIETRYVKRLKCAVDRPLPSSEESRMIYVKKDDKEKGEGMSKKRKRNGSDDDLASDMKIQASGDEEKLSRTVFVGNLPMNVKKKAIVKEFSQYGVIDSVRLSSIPIIDHHLLHDQKSERYLINVTSCRRKFQRRGAVFKAQVNKGITSQHAYIVFKELSHANAAHAHNMKELNGNLIRVDAPHGSHGITNGNPSSSYDNSRSILIGNLPFDVQDEELYQVFTPDMDVEAISVVRDSHTSLSKGIAFVLFKTKESARHILAFKRKMKLRDRILRISHVLQNKKQDSTPTKHSRKLEEYDNDEIQPQRKRAKPSVSYKGVQDSTKFKHDKRSQIRSKNSHPKRQIDMNKEGSKSLGKRKRVEKTQRGISRSKKIRRA